MLHEITHISIGLEDIHPPAFFELLDEIRQQYYAKLSNGEVTAETDVTKDGQLKTVEDAARDVIRRHLEDRRHIREHRHLEGYEDVR